MAYDQKHRDAVRSAYIYKSLSLKDAARINDIPYNTARTWKKASSLNDDDWDNARSAARLAGGGLQEVTNYLLENFSLNAQSLMEEVRETADMSPGVKADIMSKLTDSYSKLVASVAKSGSTVAPLAIGMQVIMLLMEFIKEDYPHHADSFVEIIEPFGRRLTEELG